MCSSLQLDGFEEAGSVKQEDIVDELHQLERERRLVVCGVVQFQDLMVKHVLGVVKERRRSDD